MTKLTKIADDLRLALARPVVIISQAGAAAAVRVVPVTAAAATASWERAGQHGRARDARHDRADRAAARLVQSRVVALVAVADVQAAVEQRPPARRRHRQLVD